MSKLGDGALRAQSVELKWFFPFVLCLFLVLGLALWAWPSRVEAAENGTIATSVSVPIPLARPGLRAGESVAAIENARPTAVVTSPVVTSPMAPPVAAPTGAALAPSGTMAPVPDQPRQVLDRIMNVVILGDSLGDGLWAGLYRELKSDGRFNIVKRSKVSTGFVRRDYFDWNAEVENVLNEEQVDIAIIMIGTNDRQVIVDDAGRRHRLRAPGWEAAYKERIDRFTASLKDRGVLVYWVGLPVMRSPRFGGDMRYFNGIFAERAQANGVPFIPTWEELADSAGAYTAYGPDTSGRRRLLRADDGIHFTLAGYRVLASVVADDLIGDRDAGIVPGVGNHRSSVDAPVSNYSEIAAIEMNAPAAEISETDELSAETVSGAPDAGEPLVASSIEKAPVAPPVLRPGRADDWRWPQL